jgi:hypothetical protein
MEGEKKVTAHFKVYTYDFAACWDEVTKWGSWGYDDGQLREPRGLAFDAFGMTKRPALRSSRRAGCCHVGAKQQHPSL